MATKRGRPPTFTRDDLIAAALRVGPEQLTLQAVARELGVARSSLYWHVRDRSEAGGLVLAHLVEDGGGADWALDDDASWDEWLTSYARVVRQVLTSAGGWARFVSPRLAFSSDALRTRELLLGVMVEAGFPLADAGLAFSFVFRIIFAHVRMTMDLPIDRLRADLRSEIETGEEEFRLIRQALASDRSAVVDAQFEHDLECALRGIGARSGVALGARFTTRREDGVNPAAG